ncbi:MAG: glycosyltransferase family 39 protein [Oligoflexia bacterium]|nr:glycosyltransferase family 39 protein [Oligoflexia bacterium]
MLQAQKIKSYWPLALIVVLAAFPRLYNLGHGMGVHPDERHMIMVANDMHFADLNPHSFAYGSFPYYLLFFSAHALSIFSKFLAGYDGLFWVGRVLCVMFGLAGIVLTAQLAQRIYADKRAGLIAALLLSLNVFHLQLSRFYTVDVILATLGSAALLCMVMLVQGGGLWIWLACGVFLGLSVATKITALFMLAPLGVTGLLVLYRDWRGGNLRRALPGLLLILPVAGVAFLIAEPYAILDFARFRHDAAEQTSMVQGLWRPPYTIQYMHTAPYLYHLKQMALYTMGWPVAIAVLLGLSSAIYRQFKRLNPAELVALAYVIPAFLMIARFQVKFPRYLIALYPVLLIFAAEFLVRVATAKRAATLDQTTGGMPAADPAIESRRKSMVGAGTLLGILFPWRLDSLFQPKLLFGLGALLLSTGGAALVASGGAFNPAAWIILGVSAVLGARAFSPQLSQFGPEARLSFIFTPLTQVAALIGALLCCFLAWASSSPVLPSNGQGYWLMGMVLIFCGLLAVPIRRVGSAGKGEWRATGLLVAIVMLGAVIARVVALNHIPFFVHGDEGENARVALEILNGRHSLFDRGHLNAPNLAFGIQSLFLSIFGVSVEGARLGSAIIGLAGLLIFFVLVHENYGSRTALIALTLAAFLNLHLWLSRVGTTHGQGLLFSSLAALFLFRTLRFDSRRMALLCGVSLGLALQSYWSLRPLVLICFLALLLPFAQTASSRRHSWWNLLCLLLGIVLGSGPALTGLFTTAGGGGEQISLLDFFTGTLPDGYLAARSTDNYLIALLSQMGQLIFTPLTLNQSGSEWFGAGRRMLLPVIGGAYVVMLLLGLSRGVRGIRSRTYENALWFVPSIAVLIFSWYLGFPADLPGWQRMGAELPFIILLAAFFISEVAGVLTLSFPRWRLGECFVLVVLFFSTEYGITSFFRDPYMQADTTSTFQTSMIRSLERIPKESHVYLFTALDNTPTYQTYYSYGSIWLSRPGSVGSDIQVSGSQIEAVLRTELDRTRDAAFVFYLSDKERVFPHLRQLLPNGYLSEVPFERFKNGIGIYQVAAADLILAR